jgi:hypothetical protein
MKFVIIIYSNSFPCSYIVSQIQRRFNLLTKYHSVSEYSHVVLPEPHSPGLRLRKLEGADQVG